MVYIPYSVYREGFCGAEMLIRLSAIQARFFRDRSHADIMTNIGIRDHSRADICHADDTNLKDQLLSLARNK
jgi:hypothetical protein